MENRLFIGGEVHRTGGVGVVFSGDVAVDTLIAQGCRPIGEPMLVTRCQQTLLQELDGRPALLVLSELYQSLEARTASSCSSRSSSGSRCARTRWSTSRASCWSATCSEPTSAPARSPWEPTSGR